MTSQGAEGKPMKKTSKIKDAYLVVYNTSLVVGWSMVLSKAVVHIKENNSFDGLYKQVEFWLKISQSAALLELLHSMFGLVRSSIANALPQVASRIFILWIILDPLVMEDIGAANTIGFPMLLFAWSITEIIRYSYYATALIDAVPYALQWCRYSFFLVLYPTGVSGELICMYRSFPEARRTGKFSILLPNRLNFGFDFVFGCYLIFAAYGPVFYQLFTFMLCQRKKIIGGEREKKD